MREPAPSPRYTPVRPVFRIRPTWQKVLGWALVAVGALIVVLNDVQWIGDGPTLLPGGHSEAYLLLGVAVAAYGAWWLGLFDRPSSPT